MIKVKLITILICLSFLPNHSYAFNKYIQKIWNTNSGLPQNSIEDIVQTQDGFIWIATHNGLARFDGVKFKIFKRSDLKNVKSPSIKKLYVDNNNNLWIGTAKGLAIKKNDKFYHFDKLSNYSINAIFQDSNGAVWVGTNNHGLFKYSGEGFENFYFDEFANNAINEISSDSENRLVLGTDKGLYAINKNTLVKHKNITDIVTSICKTKSNNLIIGTWGNGIKILNKSNITHLTEKQGLINNFVSTIYRDKENNIWIGTEKGISSLKKRNFYNHTVKDGLPDNSIISIFRDKESNLWVGTYSAGLNMFSEGKFTTFTKQDGLTDDTVWTVFEDSRNNLSFFPL